jgi:flavin-dependent dehydrogenase
MNATNTAGTRADAVVIGASMAGLLAARVLADHFARVTLIDRDRLPEGAAYRPGVPHSRHLHILLARGLEILTQLFPGIDVELRGGGNRAVPPGRHRERPHLRGP